VQCTEKLGIWEPLLPPISIDIKRVPVVSKAIKASVSTVLDVLDIDVEDLSIGSERLP
jgi:hypothetical protein